ncbi:phospholipase D family protein [Brevundimonas sp.]|uniref:phospholipase D family protein n=1 Tax=Brevundimonas sp. TaxID=1871086 RepID=UPI0028ADDC03|nr:phospholipase D family protein [Brevundimonas sp.]
MQFLDEKTARQAVAAKIASSTACDLAVAFWGAGATETLGLSQRSGTASVVCNLAMGGTNPGEIRALMAVGVKVEQADDLHAKVYLFDDAVILGSSNASSNGLAFQPGDGVGWREANILVEDPDVLASVKAWRSSLEVREITEADLSAAEQAWRRRRSAAAPPAGITSLLAMLEDNPGYFDDRPAYLVLSMTGMTPEADRLLDQISALAADDLSAYRAFPGLPDEAHLLDFWIDEKGRLEFAGCFERTPRLKDRPLLSGDLQLCLQRPDVMGLHYHPGEQTRWEKIADAVRRSALWNKKHNCAAVRMSDLPRLLKAHAPAAKAPPAMGERERFHGAMVALCQRIFSETTYTPHYFRQMLDKETGLLVAKKLMAKGVSDGFQSLFERGRLDLTVEAVVTDPEWSPLFDPSEVKRAGSVLKQAGYSPPS